MSAITDDELRAMVRESIARALGQQGGDVPVAQVTVLTHSSHHRYTLPESGGPCIIEPTVQCNHCGYCQSHGH
jgi:hypothetical protein